MSLSEDISASAVRTGVQLNLVRELIRRTTHFSQHELDEIRLAAMELRDAAQLVLDAATRDAERGPDGR